MANFDNVMVTIVKLMDVLKYVYMYTKTVITLSKTNFHSDFYKGPHGNTHPPPHFVPNSFLDHYPEPLYIIMNVSSDLVFM